MGEDELIHQVREELKKTVKEIENLAKQVDAKNIVLYPYAHLSSSLSKPYFAQKILESAEKELKKITEKYFTAESLELAEKDVKIEIKEKPSIQIQPKTDEVIKEEDIPVPLKVDELEVITVDTTLEETVEISETDTLSEAELEEIEAHPFPLKDPVHQLDPTFNYPASDG